MKFINFLAILAVFAHGASVFAGYPTVVNPESVQQQKKNRNQTYSNVMAPAYRPGQQVKK